MVKETYEPRKVQKGHALRVSPPLFFLNIGIKLMGSLPDYLTYRATTNLARSNCSLACKCSFVPPGATMVHECDGGAKEISKDGWSARFFNKIGMFPSTFISDK
jgi:hypothetical protein